MQEHFTYCDMRNVRLLGGTVFAENQEQMNAYLLSVDDDQMLYNFRRACGLDTRGAQPMTGWDAEDGKLRGHTTGHYLSALALAWAATGKERFREKAEYLVEGLAECQASFDASDDYHPGFLSAYSEEQFDLLEIYTPYPEIWAPYYTMDKIMSGLYDAFRYLGSQTALAVESRMGDWVYERLVRLPEEQRERMWEMYIAGEYGGMIATLVRLYRKTGKWQHLEAAKLFFNKKLFDPMAEGRDTLEEMHANQHIPQIIGALEFYRTTGEERYFKIAENFWKIVATGHTYETGGVGESERFHARGSMDRYLTEKTQESCASYNMLRLTGALYQTLREMENAGAEAETGATAKAMLDYYENTLINHIMTSCSHKPDGGTLYFLPVQAQAVREILLDENSCCHGTGMESRYRYMEHIFGEDDQAVYVNLLVDAVLTNEYVGNISRANAADFKDAVRAGRIMIRGIRTGQITVTVLEDLKKGIRIHKPGWAETGRDTYYKVDGPVAAGTKIKLEVPFQLQIKRCACNPKYAVFRYGPQILAGVRVDEQKGRKAEEVFRDEKMSFVPLNRIEDEQYQIYFEK